MYKQGMIPFEQEFRFTQIIPQYLKFYRRENGKENLPENSHA